jgi:hypothetical protein
VMTGFRIESLPPAIRSSSTRAFCGGVSVPARLNWLADKLQYLLPMIQPILLILLLTLVVSNYSLIRSY